jgi:hypothetical protein
MKNVKISISPAAIKQAFLRFMHRFHVVIFVIVVLGGVAASVLILNGIVVKSNDPNGATSSTNNADFNQDTIKRIDELKTRDQSGDTLDLSKGRTNPFVE